MVAKVHLIGFGLGNPAMLTEEARRALKSSELVIASRRILDSLTDLTGTRLALTDPAHIAQALEDSEAKVASILMSGDIGYYSGATRLLAHLGAFDVHPICGISSLQYLCARLEIPWQDVHSVSVHGRDADVCGAVQTHTRTFVLTGGTMTVGAVAAALDARGLGTAVVHVGERLSYPDERILTATATELKGMAFDQLAVMLVANDRVLDTSYVCPSLADDAFARNGTPMTKEEVRACALAKLRIRRDDVVWDVGAGTGSVSIEAARLACAGQVFAIERDARALEVLEQNRHALGSVNLTVVAGTAPAALHDLPAPDRVFVGGSSGELPAILDTALAANPAVRICVAAVTLETLSSALALARDLDLTGLDVISLSVAKAKRVANLHLMRAHNPVYLVSAFGPQAPGEA